MKTKNIAAVMLLWAVIFSGCRQPFAVDGMREITYGLELSVEGAGVVEEYSRFYPYSGTEQTVSLNITLTNTGNWYSGGINVILTGDSADEFALIEPGKDPDDAGNRKSWFSLPDLPSGGQAEFTVLFPSDKSSGLMRAGVAAGDGKNTAQKLNIQFGYYTFVEDSSFDITEPVLQLGNAATAVVSTTHASKGTNVWVSTDTAVARLAEDGAFHAAGPGSTVAGFISSTSPFIITGKQLTVYPAIQELIPEYPVILSSDYPQGLIQRNQGGYALPVNGPAIEAAALGGTAVFSYTGGGDVITDIDSDSGGLEFGGSSGTAPLTVNLEISKTVPGGNLITHRGASNFQAAIGTAPPPEIISAAKTFSDLSKIEITAIFSDYLQADGGDAKDGFAITKDGTAMTITSAAITDNRIVFTLNSQFAGPENTVILSYDETGGCIWNGDSGLESFTGFAVTVEGSQPPEVIDAVLDGGNPQSLVITWDKEIAGGTDHTGFSLSASGLNFTGASVNGSVLTLTLNRVPLAGDVVLLKLSYNGFMGTVEDSDGTQAASFSDFAVTVENDSLFPTPPVPVSAVINKASPTDLVVTFDQAVKTSNAAASTGFSLSGSAAAAAFTGVSGSGSVTLTLQLNRMPSYDEFQAHGGAFTLAYDQTAGNLKADDGDAVAASFSIPVTETGFAVSDSRPLVEEVYIDAALDQAGGSTTPALANAKYVRIRYSKAVKADNYIGFTIAGSATATDFTGAVSVITGVIADDTLVLTLEMGPSESESGSVTLSYSNATGSVRDDANNDMVAADFSDVPVALRNFSGLGGQTDDIPPKIKSVTVENAAPSLLRVEFSEPVTIADHAKFKVKVNIMPKTSLATASGTDPALDVAMDSLRDISAAESGGGGGRIWNLTMPAAAHGEILRLETTTAGAAVDTAGNDLAIIPQFIARNLVKRVRGNFENTPGLYKNGETFAAYTGSGATAWKSFLTLIGNASSFHNAGNIQSGDVFVLVLPVTAQNQGMTFPWWHTTDTNWLTEDAQGASIIVTTPLGNTQDVVITVGNNDGTHVPGQAAFQARNGMTWIIEDHIVFERTDLTTQADPATDHIIYIADGGKVIFDGGVVRNVIIGGNGNKCAPIRMGGGSYGGLFIMNSGKITGCRVKYEDTTQAAAGAVSIDQYGIFVMHGGEISGNEVLHTTAVHVAAGAVAARHTTNAAYHGCGSFFMTGGEIKGNKVSKTIATAASAGGVLVSGTFQKVGGTIYGSTGDPSLVNTTAMTGNVKPGAAAVLNTNVVNTPLANAKVRDSTSTPQETLFVDSYKFTNSAAGTNSVPAWAASYWDE